ncbi:MAG TPA: RNA polymerase sigma factor [Roseiflexaceae bacterium]|nr:RNA polymerase sigma factor [Roseiflexaceae bacterium]
MNEPELIERAQRGEAAAWEALVSSHQEPVFRLAFLMTGQADEAADIAQETFLRAFQALGGFDPQRPLRPWLLRIAGNQARNARRTLRRALAAVQRIGRSDPPLPAADWTAGWSEAVTLWQAVRRLGQADQEIIYLRFFLDLSEAEAARALDVAAGTAKSRLSRALGRLRALIAAEFPTLCEEYEG